MKKCDIEKYYKINIAATKVLVYVSLCAGIYLLDKEETQSLLLSNDIFANMIKNTLK